jgi:hypothetical protein
MKIVEINELSTFLEWWPTILESLDTLNKTQKWEFWHLTPEHYFRAATKAATTGDKGIFLLAISDQGEYLGYVFGYEQVVALITPVMHLFSAFSNKKESRVYKFLVDSFDQMSKDRGYSVTTFCTSRFGGSVFRFAEDRLKYRRVNITFAKEL